MRQYFFEMYSKRLELRELCFPPDQPASSPPCYKGSSYLMKAVASCTRASLRTQTPTVTVYHKVYNLLISFWTSFQLISTNTSLKYLQFVKDDLNQFSQMLFCN